MAFPPAEENLEVSPEFIGEAHLFGSKIVAIGGYPVINTRHPIADHPDFFIRLIDARSSRQHDGIIKDDTSWLDVIHADDGLFRLWGDKRIDQTFSETVLAFQYGQACQAHLLETGSLQPFVIEINAVVFTILEVHFRRECFTNKKLSKRR